MPFARFEVCGLAEAADDWRRLEATAPCSPYQTLAWAAAWCATVGAADRAVPFIVVARGAAGDAVALLPLVRIVRYGLRVAMFVGGRDSNSNLGIFRDAGLWDETAVRRLLVEAASRERIDAYAFINQPETWAGLANPLGALPGQPSPSANHSTALPVRAGEAITARLSKHARKLLRQKETRLRERGAMAHQIARTGEETDDLIDVYAAWKRTRAAQTGTPPPSEGQIEFLKRAARPDGRHAPMELHTLVSGPAVVAILGGTAHQQRFSGMVLGFDPSPEVARCSPGELLVKAVVENLMGRGFAVFDLGIGEARYKDTFCDVAEPLVDCFLGVTPKGRVAMLALSRWGRIKRRIKRSDTIWPRLTRLRAALGRRGRPT